MTFNWQELDRNSFMSFVLIHLLGTQTEDKAKLAQFSTATNHFKDVTITMQINGVEVEDPESLFIRFKEYFDTSVAKYAHKHILEHTRYQTAEDIMDSTFREAREVVRRKLKEKGFDVGAPEDWE